MEEAYPRDLEGLRCCSRCLTWKPRTTEHFFNDGDGPKGLSRSCKPCDREYQSRRNAEVTAGNRVVKPVRADDGRLRANRRRPTGVRALG